MGSLRLHRDVRLWPGTGSRLTFQSHINRGPEVQKRCFAIPSATTPSPGHQASRNSPAVTTRKH